MAGKSRKSKEGRVKKKGRGMSSLFACLGGCGGRVPREDAEEITQLDFRHFSLTEVPPDVFACECSLETLYLDSNQLAELPRELFHCHGLKKLSLSDNELKTLPQAMAELTGLQTLDVSKNNLSGIPDSIKSCRELRSVDASVNPLCRLPEGFTQLIALKELFLNDTFLEYLPANFGRLASLEVLELRENQLNTLPKSLARLTNLKRLDIGSNEFSQLPEVVGSLCSLKELWFDGNRVRSVAPFIGQLSQLAYLDGSNNRIDSLPDELAHCKVLTDLHLSINHLKTLPDSLCECSSLQVLRLDDNALGELPADIGALSKLTELVVTKNDLENLPTSIGLLRNLHTLHADDNVLMAVPSEIGSCVSLTVLTLAANRLPALPPEIGHLASLRVLNVWDNCIRNLPVSFSKLKLMALWLSDNQAKPAVQLQTETDSRTGQKVLTCYMLPQLPGQRRDEAPKEKEEPFPAANWEEKHKARSIIKFSFDEAESKTGAKLSRAPTPYPKELRALAKHARNLTGGSRNSVGEEDGGSKRESRGEEGVVEVRGRREGGPPGEERNRKSLQEEQVPETSSGGTASVQLLAAGSVKAEYQAAAASHSNTEFGSQRVVKTANKTSPESVMAGAPSAPSEAPTLSARDKESGLVAPPVEEGPPQLREARAVLQSLQPQRLQPGQGSAQTNEPEGKQTNAEPVSSAWRSQGTPNKPTSVTIADNGVNWAEASHSPTKVEGVVAMDTLSDDETPADLLAEALAVADVVANSNRMAAAEDPADRSSTDSGYGRPSHITNSLNDVSDRSSDLVSPVSSLPPETPTSPSSNSVKHNTFSYSNSSTPHQSPLEGPTQPNSCLASPATTPQKTLYQRHPPVTTEFPARGLPSPSPNSFSPSLENHRMTYGGPNLQQPRPGSLALASLAESGVLSNHAGYLNRPGSLAAPCNTLGIPPAPPTRAISAATGLNHATYGAVTSVSARSGALSALPAMTAENPYGIGKTTPGGLYTIQQNSPTSPTFPPTSNSAMNSPVASPNGNLSAYNNSTSSQGDRGSPSINSSNNVSGPKYYTPSSRIPMNKQLSTSSMDSNESSRIPSYTSQLSNKSQSSDSGSKIPQYGSVVDNNTRIPSLSTTGRSYSNLSNKSVNQEQIKNLNNCKSPDGTFDGYSNQNSGIRAPPNGSFNATPLQQSRVSYSGPSPNYNSNIKTPTQISAGGNFRSPTVTNGSGLPTPSKPSSLPSPVYNSGIPSVKSTGIPAPGYTRSNSTLSNSDKESRIPSMNPSSSFGKSSVAHNNNHQLKNNSSSRIPTTPYSPNTSFEPVRDFRSGAPPPQSRLPNPQYGGAGYRSPGVEGVGFLSYCSPVNQAINTPGLPPLLAPSSEGRRPSIPQLQQPKAGGSKIPQFGVPSGALAASPPFSDPGSGSGSQHPSTGRPLSAQLQQQPQSAPWMFGNHQNARVFPVVIEKDPGPGFTLTETSHPEKCLFVSSVVPHGPASSALKIGDKILQIDGEAINEVDGDTLAALTDDNNDTLTLLVSRLHS